MTCVSLDSLLEDPLIEILAFADVSDILRFRRVCHRLSLITHLRPVWLNAVLRLIYAKGLLPFGAPKSLSEMSASELENSATGTVKLASNLSSHSPTATMTVLIRDRIPNSYITQVLILPGRAAKWFVSVAAGRNLTFWEVLDQPLGALQAGSWDCEGHILDVEANRVAYSSEAVIALTQKYKDEFRTQVMGFGSSHFTSGEILEVKILHSMVNQSGRLKALHGDHVFFYRRKKGILTIINWRTGGQFELKSIKASSNSEEYQQVPFTPSGSCLAIEVIQDHVILVTALAINFFRVDLSSSAKQSNTVIEIPSTYLHIFDWEMKAASIQVHEPPPYLGLPPSSQRPSLTIIARGRHAISSPVDSISAYHFAPSNFSSRNGSPSTLIDFPWDGATRGMSCDAGAHFHPEIKSSSSGRGVWMQREMHTPDGRLIPIASNPDPSEALAVFDVAGRSPKGDYWPPTVGADFRRSSQCALFSGVELKCTTMDYDDANGRVIIGSFDSKLRIVDYA